MKPILPAKYHHILQQLLFYAFLITLVTVLARVSLVTDTVFDMTAENRHSLSASTVELLDTLDRSIEIEVFISPQHEFYPEIEALLSRYQKQSDQLTLLWTDPAQAPQRIRELQIQQQGEMHLRAVGRTEKVLDLSEQSLSNALFRLSRDNFPHLYFIEGHGERHPDSQTNFDLSHWNAQLQNTGFKIDTLNLTRSATIPADTDLLIIASADRPWLEGEIKLLNNYLDLGGHLLWLAEPDARTDLSELASALDIQLLPGVIIDPNSARLGVQNPSFVLISNYANHPVTQSMQSVTLLPTSAALQYNGKEEWQVTELLKTQPESWIELSAFDKSDFSKVTFNAELDLLGPHITGLLLERPSGRPASSPQRVAVIGDGDFVANSYLGNGANLELAMALVSWLTQQEEQLSIPVKQTRDSQLKLSFAESVTLALGFLLLIPLALLAAGFIIRWRRQKR